ncbi:MAG: DUF4145 domain-containing protein [Muribaculaceae bacterium]|nr:DUF4145 domain-containing protein [Muribaculaceae bacterium]
MKINLNDYQIIEGVNITLICPHCGNRGTFVPIVKDILSLNDDNKPVILGIRKCPNPNCGGYSFIIQDASTNDVCLESYPTAKMEFKKDSIPQQISETFEEAIVCYANQCYVASAIMVRKTLEQLCEDKGTEGKNLKERLQALVKTITMPHELKEGMDMLRILGNNAAHVRLTDFDSISEKELSVSIQFTKEVLKSVYQFDKLLSALRALKKE